MLYDILRDFKGSQDGRFTVAFKAGTRADLSDYLAAAIDPTWARAVVDHPGPEPVVFEHQPGKPPGIEPVSPAPMRRNKGGR